MTMQRGGAKVWYTAQELADLGLPGLSRAKRKVNELANAARWAVRVDAAGMPLARPRAGRGGGLEYNIALLPPAAALELAKRGLVTPPADNDAAPEPADLGQAQSWSWYDAQSASVKQEAEARLVILQAVEAAISTGATATLAVATVAASHGRSASAVWEYRNAVAGVRSDAWLPALAPRRKGGGKAAEVNDAAWDIFRSDYLRPEKPTYASCYGRLQLWANENGVELPALKTLQRKLEREVDGRLVIAKRNGHDALRQVVPAQRRTVAALQALELVNIDGHRWDVFVKWPDGHVARPMMVCIQDVYSRKILAWRIGQTESAVLTRLAFADLFKTWGIPDQCLMDNGRAFASKWISGGAKSRFRFKIREEEPTGLLTALGVKIHWATPYRGQSKPIERAFRDLCDSVAKHPAFHGAYTGNRPDAKPENYGEKAVPLDVFLRVATQGIEAHNAKTGRRTEIAAGGSFNDAFHTSYARSAVRKAGPEQLRLALLAADQVTAKKPTGAVEVFGNVYWSEDLYRVAGQKVTVRFDPDDLTAPVHVYGPEGAFIATAAVIDQKGFLDADAARTRGKQEADLRKAVRRAAELEKLLTPAQVAALLPSDAADEEPPEPAAIRPVRAKGNAMAKVASDVDRAPLIDRFMNFAAPTPASQPSLTVLDGGLK